MPKVAGRSHSQPTPEGAPVAPLQVVTEGLSHGTDMQVGNPVAPGLDEAEQGLLDTPRGYSAEERQRIAQTTLAQINAGDAWLRARLGVRNLSHSSEGCKITLHMPCSDNVAVNVTYVGGADTYTIESFKIQPRRAERISAYMIEDVYADQLVPVIEKAFQKAIAVKAPKAAAVDRREGWLREVKPGDQILVGTFPDKPSMAAGRRQYGPTFDLATVIQISDAGRISLDNGEKVNHQGMLVGKETKSGVIPFEPTHIGEGEKWPHLKAVTERLLQAHVPTGMAHSVSEMPPVYQVGVAVLPAFTHRENFEVAAWYRDLAIPPQVAPIYRHSGTDSVSVLVRGTVMETWTPTLLGGVQVDRSYDSKQGAGNECELLIRLSDVPQGTTVVPAPK